MITAKMVLTPTGLIFPDRSDIEEIKREFTPGELLEVNLRRWSDSRSARQRRTIHALWQAMAEAWGQSVEDVKLMQKYRHGLKVDMDDIAMYGPPDWPGKWFDPTRSPLCSMFPNYENHFWFLQSESAWTMAEEARQITQNMQDCFDAQIDIQRIVDGMQERELGGKK